MMLDEKALEAAAIKIWESESHPLMQSAGHAVDWPNLNKSVKRSVIRKAKLAIEEYMRQINNDDQLNQDKLRLDLLDTVNAEFNKRNGTTYGWAVDWNHNRISLRDSDAMKKSVRQAIDDFSSRIKR